MKKKSLFRLFIALTLLAALAPSAIVSAHGGHTSCKSFGALIAQSAQVIGWHLGSRWTGHQTGDYVAYEHVDCYHLP